MKKDAPKILLGLTAIFCGLFSVIHAVKLPFKNYTTADVLGREWRIAGDDKVLSPENYNFLVCAINAESIAGKIRRVSFSAEANLLCKYVVKKSFARLCCQ